ncbi:uncharacterized protein LOC114311939 [Camellia sinensis]|uniref:uncharacterized protein LOC114311939 n=1 Tax=Camellia sinensis TaxID=4442 RepID=UPI001035A201|nr:uncharacterized protein LOC114311939 [Camellia sinensis]
MNSTSTKTPTDELQEILPKVGDGKRIIFWKDRWCSNNCLKDEFSTLYRLVMEKEAAMLNWWEVQGALPGSVEAILHWWEGVKLGKKEKLLWKVIPSAVFLSLWKLQNECIFQNSLCSSVGKSLPQLAWHKEVFGSVNVKLKEAEEELHFLDLAAESRDLDEAERARSRIVRDQQSRNAISSISVRATVLEDPTQIRKEVIDHFRKLEADFSEEEIRAAVKDCVGNKALGPDSFNLAYFQKFWLLIKADLLKFFKEFHRHERLVLGLNSSFISLIPKVENPVGHGDYRPISLMGSIYKVLTKVLSSKLKKVLPHIISDTQSAFIGGRNILDGVLIANEAVDGWRKTKKRGLIIKLDFEKTFDSVNWCFLSSMLFSFGFGTKWIRWIKECVTTV